MTTDQPTAAELWASIDPATLSVDQLLLYELNRSVDHLRVDVRSERADRIVEAHRERRSTRLSLVGLTAAILLAVFVGRLFATSVERERNQACVTRAESRAAIRSGIAAAVDEVAIYAEIPDDERTELRRRASERVYQELGPPDC